MKSKSHQKFLLIIDGPMGSGKTTVSTLLHKKLKRTAHIGLDRIKWLISDFKKVTADNDIVRNIILAMTKEYLRQGINVIVEQGMTKERIENLTKIAKKYDARLLGYQLDAPKEVLFNRIAERQKLNKKTTVSKARIERNYQFHLQNKYTGLVLLDTEKLNAQQIANRILKDIRG
jgi:predicted kinase